MNYDDLKPEFAKQIKGAYLLKEYRPVAVAILSNKENKYLFVQSAKNLDDWGLPQGGIEEGELPLDALIRELKEELGISEGNLCLLGFLGGERLDAEALRKDKRGFGKGKMYFFFSFLYLGRDDSIIVNPEEINTYCWVELFDIGTILSTTRTEK